MSGYSTPSQGACQLSLSEAQTTLLNRLHEALRVARSKDSPRCCAVRVETPIEPVDPLPWLAAQSEPIKVYWSDRGGLCRAAGVGAAESLRSEPPFEDLFKRISVLTRSEHEQLRFYGGLAFDRPSAPTDPWHAFGPCWFVLPRAEVVRTAEGCYLACNAVLDSERCLDSELEATGRTLQALVSPDARLFRSIPRLVSRQDVPEKAEWTRQVRRTLKLFHKNLLDKVVLARETILDLEAPPDPFILLERLTENSLPSYHFCFQPQRGTAFLGVSPERLYCRAHRRLSSEAIAGTRPRGATPEADDALGRELLASEKDRHEHRLVMEAIQSAFGGLCVSSTSSDQVDLLRLDRCQHLSWTADGTLREGATDAAILKRLHPTPAVGGHPTPQALNYIREVEPFDRGWYAGPVGWIGRDAAEFAVAIRAGLVHRNRVVVYSGAGLVAGSAPEQEWAEIEHKISQFLILVAGNHA